MSRCFGLALLLGITSAEFAVAAPLPATSSSALITSHRGLFRSELGFEIHAGQTGWQHIQPSTKNSYVAAIYRAPEVSSSGVQPSLTVRIDQLKKETRLSEYVRQWKKDYPRFGFDIREAKTVKVRGKLGFMVDLLNAETNKQLRQVVFLKEKTAVILTCRDHHRSFAKTVKACNEIVRNFNWL